jgi:hypothetical protein
VIDGRLYQYRQDIDVIWEKDLETGVDYDRTQVVSAVDLCIELTRKCNLTCLNCFSESVAGQRAPQANADQVAQRIRQVQHEERLTKLIVDVLGFGYGVAFWFRMNCGPCSSRCCHPGPKRTERTPWLAKFTSPDRRIEPPPIGSASETERWGEPKG